MDFRRILGVACSLGLLCGVGTPRTTHGNEPDFEREIAPLLARRCLSCHAGDDAKAGLDLTRRESALRGGESGPALLSDADDPQRIWESPLWQRVVAGEMPPNAALPVAEQQLLRDWLTAGATWPEGAIDPFRYSTESRAGVDWWSLQPLAQVSVPATDELAALTSRRDVARIRQPVDAFVLAGLVGSGLYGAGIGWSPDAEPRLLARRLSFDLVGLPPDPELVEQFVANPSEAAYEQLVDNLLASPAYGERWARWWLDIARYGESSGFELNGPRHTAWPYRDWVIAALNRDLSYDQFAFQQLAGDTADDSVDGAAAVGFLVAGIHNTVVGSSERMRLLARQDELEEIAGTVAQTFLGLTLNCARCHDHKFDPISVADYYGFIAALDGIEHGERSLRTTAGQRAIELATAELKSIEQQLEVWRQRARNELTRRALASPQSAPGQAAAETSSPVVVPIPYASWGFESGFADDDGRMTAEPHGEARLEGGALVLAGPAAYVSTSPLPIAITEKTLEAWVRIEERDQRGGAVISLETLDGGRFDAIVYGEIEPQHWMAGSDGFRRTQSFQAPAESASPADVIHVAITYSADGRVTGYRQGQPYGQPYRTTVETFRAGETHLTFGLRHRPVAPGRLLTGQILQARLYDVVLSPEEVAASAARGPRSWSEAELLAALPPADRAAFASLLADRDHQRQQLEILQQQDPLRSVYTVKSRQPGPMRIHRRGDVTLLAEETPPGSPARLSHSATNWQLTSAATDHARRQALARWITHPEQALFPRVIVNRVWQAHFGRGLVETPSDLGFNGGQPSHPQLLDWLAGWFRDHGYSLKALHRLLVLSTSYRQAAAPRREALLRDAGNRWLWRQSPRRIEGEMLHDSLLAFAGLLNPAAGGPGYLDVSITLNNNSMYYEPIDVSGPDFDRRTIYRFTPRGGRSAVLDVLDCPDPSVTAPRRNVTTTPLQSLSLLNNTFVWRTAAALADRVEREVPATIPERPQGLVRHAWRRVLSREPTDEEAALSVQLVSEYGLPALCRALFNTNELIVIE